MSRPLCRGVAPAIVLAQWQDASSYINALFKEGNVAPAAIHKSGFEMVLKHGLWATTIYASRYRESSEVVPKALLLR